jgi:protein-tyrosine-phosphatase
VCNGKGVTDVLFLCTGNLCRSPSAALLLSRHLERSGTTGVMVHSAGTLGAPFGSPDLLVEEARPFGIDLGDHTPRRFDPAMIADADLVVGLSREHVREAVLADIPSFPKSFTLRELVRRGSAVGPRRDGEALGEWLARVHQGRRHAELIGDSPDDDVVDPMGGTSDDYRVMLVDVESLTATLSQLAWP